LMRGQGEREREREERMREGDERTTTSPPLQLAAADAFGTTPTSRQTASCPGPCGLSDSGHRPLALQEMRAARTFCRARELYLSAGTEAEVEPLVGVEPSISASPASDFSDAVVGEAT